MPPITLPPLGATTAPVPVKKVPHGLGDWPVGEPLKGVAVIDALQHSVVQADAVEVVASLMDDAEGRQVRFFLVRGMLVHAIEKNRTPMEALIRCLFWPPDNTSLTWRQGLSKAGELYMAPQTAYQLRAHLAAQAKTEDDAWRVFSQERNKRTEELRTKVDDACLQAINTMLEGEVIDISALFAGEDESMRMGRSPDCEIQIDMLSISSEHCVLSGDVLEDGGRRLRVSDMRSTNGTLINGEFLLRDGTAKNLDIIQLGPVRFQLHLKKSTREVTGPERPQQPLNVSKAAPTQAGDTIPVKIFPGKITLPEGEESQPGDPMPHHEEMPKLGDLDFFYTDDAGTVRSLFGISEISEIAPTMGQTGARAFEIRAHGSSGFKHTVSSEKYDALSAKLARFQAAIRRLTH